MRLACAWADRFAGDEVRIVHVLDGAAATEGPHARASVLEALSEQARRAAAPFGVSVSCELADGDAASVLASRTEALAVVGAEGGSATLLRRAGHVTRALASRRRVLVAPSGYRAVTPKRRRNETRAGRRIEPLAQRILVACSLVPGRDAPMIAEAARLLAGVTPAELHLAHVVDVASARHHPASARLALREATDADVARAEDALSALAAEAPLELVTRTHVVRQGPIERDLAGLAESQSIGLVVAGTGDVAARLAGFVRCPLLVVTGSA